MRLSRNFTLEEFLISQTAERNGIDMTPPQEVIENLQALVHGCMQPLRDEINAPIFISSGFRPPELNKAIGGSKTSEHMNGNACDFNVVKSDPFRICELIVAMVLPYDQVINEFGKWIHLGVGNILRGEELTAYRRGGKTRYFPGIRPMETLT